MANISIPRLEWELYMGRYMKDPKKLLKSKSERIHAILQELSEEKTKKLYDDNPEIANIVAKLRGILEDLQTEIDELPIQAFPEN
jgi:hypothetical protein